MEERIVCAANKNCVGEIVLGVRHHDSIMNKQIINYREFCENLDAIVNATTNFREQGFVTNKGRYVDRQEAWKIAEAQNQIIRRVGGDEAKGGTLYSENLY